LHGQGYDLTVLKPVTYILIDRFSRCRLFKQFFKQRDNGQTGQPNYLNVVRIQLNLQPKGD